MKKNDRTYTQFSLVTEMLETPGTIRSLPVDRIAELDFKNDSVLFTGEGSSRIFPAKHAIYLALRRGGGPRLFTAGATEAGELELTNTAVYVASNSGKTAEAVRLIHSLKAKGHGNIAAVVSNVDSPIMAHADRGYGLICGGEKAVAATKSVVEQALVYEVLVRRATGAPLPDFAALANGLEETLSATVPTEMAEAIAGAPVVHFAGRDTGVAEELTLKTNEITKKRSAYLEGTYAVHGVEESMEPSDVVVVVDPFEEEEAKFEEVLVRGVGLTVLAISDRQTRFPTIRLPDLSGELDADSSDYLYLAAGWNLLVEAGIGLGLDLDKAERARKVGNEYTG